MIHWHALGVGKKYVYMKGEGDGEHWLCHLPIRPGHPHPMLVPGLVIVKEGELRVLTMQETEAMQDTAREFLKTQVLA